MAKRGPNTLWPYRLSICIGEGLDAEWTRESEQTGQRKAAIARLAIDQYFEDPGQYILLPTSSDEDDLSVRSNIQLSTAQEQLVRVRAKELSTSVMQIGGMAIAYRYWRGDFAQVPLLIPA